VSAHATPNPVRAPGTDHFAHLAEIGGATGERRIITLTVLAMLRTHHIHGKLHVKAALDSGHLTEDELREIAVQIAYYAGWPVATSFEWTVDKATGTASGVEDL
jgi:hypothetical protein